MSIMTNQNEIAAALCKAQLNIGRAIKDSTNPAFKSKYADLSAVMDACMPALNNEGIAVTQVFEETADGKPVLITRLMHTSGQHIDSFCPLFVDPGMRNPMHGLGSACTYARRYSLAAICGVAQDDDDGNASYAQKKDEAFKKVKVNAEDVKRIDELLACCEPSFREKIQRGAFEKNKMSSWIDFPKSGMPLLIDHLNMHINQLKIEAEAKALADDAGKYEGFFDDVIKASQEDAEKN